MKKTLYLIVLMIIFLLTLVGKGYGQNIKIDWQKCFGGTINQVIWEDNINSAIQTNDGGYIFVGTASQRDADSIGDIGSNNQNAPNIWVVKLNNQGKIQWKKTIDVNQGFDLGFAISQSIDSSYVVLSIRGPRLSNNGGPYDVVLLKLDKNGNRLWINQTPTNSLTITVNNLLTLKNGDILFSVFDFNSESTTLYKFDNNGNFKFNKRYGKYHKITSIIQSDNNSYFTLFDTCSTKCFLGLIKYNSLDQVVLNTKILIDSANIFPSFFRGTIVQYDKNTIYMYASMASSASVLTNVLGKLDTLGNILWIKDLNEYNTTTANIFINKKDGNLIIPNYDSFVYGNDDLIFEKYDTSGNLLSVDSVVHQFNNRPLAISQCLDGGFVVATTLVQSGGDVECFKGTTSSGWIAKIFLSPYQIIGNIFSDINNNCVQNSLEQGLENYSLKASNAYYTSYTTSRKNGKYSLVVEDTGNYNVQLIPNNIYPYFTPSNCNNYTVHLIDTVYNLNIALKPNSLCIFNVVNISTAPPFRIGRPNTYTVSFCNNGTIASSNTYIDIKLDSLLDINSASIPYTSLPNHTYRFNIGNLDFLTCGNFSFVATPRIGAVILSQTLCAEVHIYPDTICGTPNYTGAFIEASAQCLGDSVRFQLQNTGIGNMPSIKKYVVIEDNVLRINRNYQLNTNQILTETIGADSGSTYRIIAEQPDELPAIYGDKYTTAALENCQTVQGIFSTGYFTQFPNYDGEPYRSLSCNMITGSYDPNDKVASPVGYAAQHYIEANTQIDYQINFQNTGNDTAFKVVLVDTISPNLDINSIQLGVGSHMYQFQRTDSNLVQFVFDSIKLVDSFRNERLSHGFVKFKIQQKANNPVGIKIYNKADIYFDYNLPITTNKTMHTIGRDFVQVNLISGIKNTQYHVKEVKVYPNPFREQTQIIIESDALKDPVLILQTLEGQIIKSIPSSSQNTFTLYRDDLMNGMYIFKIVQNNEQIASGKLVIQ